MSTPSAAQRLVFWSGGVNGQSRGVRIVIRHGLFSCVYGISADAADAAASARLSFGLGLLVRFRGLTRRF